MTAVLAPASAQEADTSAILDVATNADPTLNPWTPGAVIESNLINTILFEQLTRYSPEDLTPSPMLATDWYAEDGGLAWVFELREGRVTLIEIAEGLDPERDVFAHMGFVPQVAGDLRVIDPRVYADGPMGLASDFREKR